MTKKRRVRKFLSSMYNVKGWLGYQEITSGAQTIKNSVATITNVEEANRVYPAESFKDAMIRMNLSEADVERIGYGYHRNFLVFFVVGVIIAIYSIYRFYMGQWLSGWVSMMMMLVIFGFSLASHFWYFQIKHRKLGCTLKEWYSNKIDV